MGSLRSTPTWFSWTRTAPSTWSRGNPGLCGSRLLSPTPSDLAAQIVASPSDTRNEYRPGEVVPTHSHYRARSCLRRRIDAPVHLGCPPHRAFCDWAPDTVEF